MVADLGTKPLAAPRLEGLKKKLRMGSLEEEVPKDEEKAEEKKEEVEAEGREDAEKEEEKRALKIQKASAVLKLIALVSAIPGTKGDDPEDELKKSYGYHLEMMLLFYTVFIVVTAFIIWWVLTRSEGPSGSGERYTTRRFNRRTLLGMYDENEDEGSEEDEYGVVHDVPRPRALPADLWDEAEACGSEAMWNLRGCQPKGKGSGAKNEKGGGKKGIEENEKAGGKKGIDENEKGGGKKGSGGKDEEVCPPQASKRDRDQHQATDVIEEAAGRVVLTTRYGRAHHGSYGCDALNGREVRRNHWCPTCLRTAGPATTLTLTANRHQSPL